MAAEGPSRGVAAGRSAQRGTSGAATGGGGPQAPPTRTRHQQRRRTRDRLQAPPTRTRDGRMASPSRTLRGDSFYQGFIRLELAFERLERPRAVLEDVAHLRR